MTPCSLHPRALISTGFSRIVCVSAGRAEPWKDGKAMTYRLEMEGVPLSTLCDRLGRCTDG
jgi:hypothetical protein